MPIWRPLPPVSYTHLDVYKRQAYILRYEFIEPDGINSYLKITEIKGDAYTDFQDALEAEKLFEAAKESAVLLFPSCGYLYTNTGGPNSEGVSGSYWTASPVNEYTVYVSIGNWQTHIDAKMCIRDRYYSEEMRRALSGVSL